jgi:hypothetical protein
MSLMDTVTLISVGWLLWAFGSVWVVRFLFMRWTKERLGSSEAYVAAYSFLLVGFVSTLWFVGWTGMPLYGFNREDPWHVAGYVSLFISPLGLPVLFGGPVVFLVDLFRRWRR